MSATLLLVGRVWVDGGVAFMRQGAHSADASTSAGRHRLGSSCQIVAEIEGPR